MPDIFYLFSKWWKQILFLVLLSLAVTAAVVFLQPRRYLSVTTALAASSILSDKARIFGDNIQHLYSSIGNPDDLDRILGTAQLDTVYIAVAASFNLWDHYKIKNGDLLYKAAKELKENTSVIKSEYGELKIKVWDTDKKLAPQLSNAILEKLNIIHQALQSESNRHTLNDLKEVRDRIRKTVDSLNQIKETYSDIPSTLRSTTVSPENAAALLPLERDRLVQYEKLIGEFQLMVDTNPSVLVVVEKARASLKPDKPRPLMTLVVAGILSFLFALFVALILERRKPAL